MMAMSPPRELNPNNISLRRSIMGRPVTFFVTGVGNYSDGYFAYKDDNDTVYKYKNFYTEADLPRNYNYYTNNNKNGRPYEIDEIAQLPLATRAPTIDDLVPYFREKRIIYYQKYGNDRLNDERHNFLYLYAIEYVSPFQSRYFKVGFQTADSKNRPEPGSFRCFLNKKYTYFSVHETANFFRNPPNIIDINFVENPPRGFVSKLFGQDYLTQQCLVFYPNEVTLGGGKISRKRKKLRRRSKSPKRKSIRRY